MSEPTLDQIMTTLKAAIWHLGCAIEADGKDGPKLYEDMMRSLGLPSSDKAAAVWLEDQSAQHLRSVAWRLADMGALLRAICERREIDGFGITRPTGRGASLPTATVDYEKMG